MKNRIWNKVKGLGIAAVLFTTTMCGNRGLSAEIWAADVDNEGISLVQTAHWTDLEQYKAEILMEIRGLEAYAEKYTQESEEIQEQELTEDSGEEIEVPDEEPEEIPDEETGESEKVLIEAVEVLAGELAESVEMQEAVPQLYLMDYISEYFRLDTDAFLQNCQTEEISAINQKGEETSITKVIYPIDVTALTEDILHITIPVILRDEYRIAERNVQYPVSQDEPLSKDCAGTGAFILEQKDKENTRLAETFSPTLEIQAAFSDFSVELTTEREKIKAGQYYIYELNVKNTGELPLSDILITSSFSEEEMKAAWEAVPGVTADGKQALITELAKGESCTLQMKAELTESQSGELEHLVLAETCRPGTEDEMITRETEARIQIEPLTAAFEVNKTADRTEAAPGDTITYQICIRNTGERTLHSVLSTERFLNANIQAQFVPKAGVVLNSTKTQALIKEIRPGEAFALLATVTLPRYFQSQELVNQVTVVSEETGEESVRSEAEVTVIIPSPTPTVTPFAYYQSGGGAKGDMSAAYPAMSKPKTGDDTETGLFAVLLIFAVMSGAGAFWHMKGKSRH